MNFKVGDKVIHDEYGKGKVISIVPRDQHIGGGNTVTMKFAAARHELSTSDQFDNKEIKPYTDAAWKKHIADYLMDCLRGSQNEYGWAKVMCPRVNDELVSAFIQITKARHNAIRQCIKDICVKKGIPMPRIPRHKKDQE